MTRGVRISLALVAAFVVGLGVLLVVDRSDAEPVVAGGASVVREDSHRLGTVAENGPMFVESRHRV